MDGKLSRSKWLLCAALLVNQSAYVTLESLQSSLNQGKGTNALAVLYVSMVVSALLLPSFVVSRFGCKKTLACSLLTYGMYTIANFYPTAYTLIPAAAILGIGAGLMWPTTFTYVTRMSGQAAHNDRELYNRLNKETFGSLYTCTSFSMVVGSLVMLILLYSTSFVFESEQGNNEMNTTQVPYQIVCGLFYENADSSESGGAVKVSSMTLYIILGGFLILNCLAVSLSLCLDDYSENEPLEEEMEFVTGEAKSSGQVLKSSTESSTLKNRQTDINPPIKDTSSLARLKCTLKLLGSDLVAILSLPHTMKIGLLQAFLRGTFMASWISCQHGLFYVSYMMLALSLSMMVSSYTSSKLLQIISLRTMFGLATILELAGFSALLLWREGEPAWPYFIIMFAFGFGRSLIKTQTPSAFATFFPHDQDAAGSLLFFSEPIGAASGYVITSFVLPIYVIIFLMPMTFVAYISFIACTLIESKDIRKTCLAD